MVKEKVLELAVVVEWQQLVDFRLVMVVRPDSSGEEKKKNKFD